VPTDLVSLTTEESARIIRGLVQAAGPGGIERAELRRQFEVAADQALKLKIQSAMWVAFSTDQIDVGLDAADELTFYPTRGV
jgi:hypothetical protein